MRKEDNPYLRNMALHDDHERDMQRSIRDRGWVAIGLFVLLLGSVYDNASQRQQVKKIPYVLVLDAHGHPVPTFLPRLDELPADDPFKELFVQGQVATYITNLRVRPMDKLFLAATLTTAKQESVGPAAGLFATPVYADEAFRRIKTERVQVELRGTPQRITPSTWIAEWNEKVSGHSGDILRNEIWKGNFTVVENPKLATERDPLGLVISSREIQEVK